MNDSVSDLRKGFLLWLSGNGFSTSLSRSFCFLLSFSPSLSILSDSGANGVP